MVIKLIAAAVAVEEWVRKEGYMRDLKTNEEAAADMGIDEVTFSRYFRYFIRKPFLSWRKEIRVERAKKMLLEHPEMPVYEIGEILGFYDKSNFKKAFRSVTGMSPREFREQYLN